MVDILDSIWFLYCIFRNIKICILFFIGEIIQCISYYFLCLFVPSCDKGNFNDI